MNAFNLVVKFFQDCGLFIYPSLAIMSMGLAIAIERFIFLNRTRDQNRKVWSQLQPLLQAGQFKEVASITSKSDAAIGKIVSYGLTRMQSPGRREDDRCVPTNGVRPALVDDQRLNAGVQRDPIADR